MGKPNLSGKTIFVTGGSSGLGKELAKALAIQGANVTIFARQQARLDLAKAEIESCRLHNTQTIQACSVDLGNPTLVEDAFRSQKLGPDALYCVAGGCQTQCGFLKDIQSADLESCMRNNYFTAAYSSQTLLRLWREVDKQNQSSNVPIHRQIVFINSAGAFLGLPGYTAYTPTKAAVRALADTLRMEVLRYDDPSRDLKYSIHVAFPANIDTEAFFEEQKNKPQLTKEMEGTAADPIELKKKLPSARKVANGILDGVAAGDFAICDSFETGLLWANMIGPSPKRGLGVIDSILAVLMVLIIWPFQRRQWDAMCRNNRDR